MPLGAACILDILVFALGAEVIAHCHAEAIRDQIGDAQHNHNAARQLRADRPSHDREGRHGTIHCPEYCVAQVAMPFPRREPQANGVGLMLGPKFVQFCHAHSS